MLFVENAGQWPAAARFQVRGSPAGAGTTWLAEDAIWITVLEDSGSEDQRSEYERSDWSVDRLDDLQPATSDAPRRGLSLKLTFPGANPNARLEPLNPLTTTVSYFIGNDPVRWHAAVPVFGGVRYADLYPGIDLVLSGHDGFWRLEAEPGAETAPVRLQVEGAEILAVDGATVRLAAQAKPLEIVLPKAPFAYQATGFSPQGEALALDVRPSIDTPRKPAAPGDNSGDLIYSTFLGGSGRDDGYALALDATGRTTVTGWTDSGDFPTTPGAFDPSYHGGYGNSFVARLNAAGSALDYATFLGGSGEERGNALALDAAARATVTGWTSSGDFPTTPGAFDTSYNGGYYDAFVVRLNAAGSALDYATFLGGSDLDGGYALALDAANSATVTGETWSSDFPTTPGAFDSSYNGEDAFVVRLNAVGSVLDYATFLGGSGEEGGNALALDPAGRTTVTGWTGSSDFPATPGAFDTSFNGWPHDAFVVRLNAAGNALEYATFLGGSDYDYGSALALDATGRAVVLGVTRSSNFPTTPGAFCPTQNVWSEDAFVVRLNAAGSALDYGTFLGGSSEDRGHGLALDAAGRATVTGDTRSSDFPTTPGAFDTSNNGGTDAFVVRLNAAGSALDYATFLGGILWDDGFALVLDAAGRATVTGWTSSGDFPTTPDAFDPSYNGGYPNYYYDAFVVKLNLTASPTAVALASLEAVAGDSASVPGWCAVALLCLVLAVGVVSRRRCGTPSQ